MLNFQDIFHVGIRVPDIYQAMEELGDSLGLTWTEVVEASKLQQIINKIETIEQERQESADLLKDVFNEAKSMGFDVKIIKHMIKLKKKDKDALAEEDSLIELYRGALNI